MGGKSGMAPRTIELARAAPGFARPLARPPLSIRREAERRGLWHFPLPGRRNAFVVTDGILPVPFMGSSPLLTDRPLTRTDKHETKLKLQALGIRVPRGVTVPPHSRDELAAHWGTLPYGAFVLKPADRGKGQGVAVGITDRAGLLRHYETIKSRKAVLEEYIDGAEHRFLVLGGRVIAVCRRTPANVTGNGHDSIEHLIAAKNRARRRIPAHRAHVITIDDSLRLCLEEQGLDLGTVIPDGQTVFVRKVSNVSQGGDSTDVTEATHPSFIEIAERIWQAFPERAIYGADLIAADLACPASDQAYAVLEVNSRPMLNGLHARPIFGKGRDVTGKLLDYIFGEDRPGDGDNMAGGTAGVHRFMVNARISGDILGGGFERWLKRQAACHGVDGWVRSRSDGTVEAALAGPRASVTRVLGHCHDGPKGAAVRAVASSPRAGPVRPGFRILRRAPVRRATLPVLWGILKHRLAARVKAVLGTRRAGAS